MPSASILIFLIVLASQTVFGQARATGLAGDVLPYLDKVNLATQGEVDSIKKLDDRVKTGDRSLCTSYRGTDMSGCAKSVILQMRIHSAEGVREMLNIPVAAALKDRDLGFGEKRSGLLLADGFLTVIEHVKTNKFFARTVRTKTPGDRTAKKTVLAQEAKLLDNFRAQAIPQVEAHLAKVDHASPSPDPQVQVWEKRQTVELHARLEKVRRARWAIQ